MTVYVTTCDKYSHLLKGFAYLFNKYWGAEQAVVVLGFAKPDFELPPNFKFHSMEEKETRPWTDNLKTYFESIDDEYFVWLMDDYWLTEKVDQTKVKEMQTCVDTGAVKGDLSNNTNHFQHTAVEDFVVARAFASYRTSTQPAIWRRDWLIGILKPGLNPWQFELQGRSPALSSGKIVGKPGQIYKFANAYYQGSPAPYMLERLTDTDKKALIDLKAFDGFKGYTP